MRFRFLNSSLVIIATVFLFFLNSASALTVKEERELGKKVLSEVKRAYPIVSDPYISDYISRLGQKMVKSSKAKLFNFNFMVIIDDTYNAFAVPGGYIFVHTGLIAAMDDESELAGILGHEIAHVNCRHIAQQFEGSKKITAASLAGLAAGILLGVNGAEPDAVMGVITGTQAAGKSAMLSYSRAHEREADNRGLKYLSNAEYSPEGLLNILKKIRSREYWTTKEAPVYLRTHPGTEERIEAISSYMENYNGEIVNKVDKSTFSEFNKVKIKIMAFYQEKKFALKKFEKMEKSPEKRPLGYYGKALLFMREGQYEESVKYFSDTLRYNALDPELLFDYGRTLFLKGEYLEAVKKLKSIRGYFSKFPENELMIARCYLELKKYKEALELLEYITDKKPDYRYGWYYQGIAHEKNGNKGEAHLSLGKYYEMKFDREVSVFHYKKAVALLTGEKKKKAEKRLKALTVMGKKGKKDKKKEGKKGEESSSEES